MPAYKRDLIAAVGKRLGVTDEAAASTVDAVLSAITDVADEHESLTLREFGHFYFRVSNPVTRYMPSSLTKVDIGRRRSLKFRCAKALRSMVAADE